MASCNCAQSGVLHCLEAIEIGLGCDWHPGRAGIIDYWAANCFVRLEERFFILSVCGSRESFEDIIAFRGFEDDVFMVGCEGKHRIEGEAEDFRIVVERQHLIVDFHLWVVIVLSGVRSDERDC